MFTRIVTSALFAGAAAGLIAALLQLYFVQPVLLHAELYETGALVHFGGDAVSAHQDVGGIDPLRDGLSILFTMLVYTGYALILIAAMAFAENRGHVVTARSGIIWGIAGFVIVHFAPGFTLAPEVPGVAAADVYERQIWWFATVATAALAVWLIAFGRNWLAWGRRLFCFWRRMLSVRRNPISSAVRADRTRGAVCCACLWYRGGSLGVDRAVCRAFLAA